MAGKSEFSEIFFDDAVIPVTDRLGDEDAGWTLVGEGLAFERIGIARYARANRVLEHLVEYARATRSSTAVRSPTIPRCGPAWPRWPCASRRPSSSNYGAISIQAAGEVPAIEASIARIHNTQVEQLAGQIGLEVLGPAGPPPRRRPLCLLDGEMQRQWLESIPVTVAAGTTEVQKNIIAQRGLGLPRSALTMDLNLDDDQRLLAESARQLFERTYTTESARDAEEPARRLLGRPLEAGLASSAGPASRCPEDCGGAGYGAARAGDPGRGARTGCGDAAPAVVVRGDAADPVGGLRRGAVALADLARRRRGDRRAGAGGAERWRARCRPSPPIAGLDALGHEDRGAVRVRRRRAGGERRPRRSFPGGDRGRRARRRVGAATTRSRPTRSRR